MIIANKLLISIRSQWIRCIYSVTGTWSKKLTRTTLNDIETHWKDEVLKPHHLHKDGAADKKYILSMFPYPSGDLHMGHMRVYTISDVIARFHRLNGYQVLHPIGWDAFGLPAENAAIERSLAPKKWTENNIERMRQQLLDLRISFDWEREFSTCNPDYYKWTQLLFLDLYSKGMAYSMKAAVNWDPKDETVLADEQIDSQGYSWRSGVKVEKKYLKQWYLRATNYSQSLLDGLNTLDPESCKGFANAQRNWIKSPTGVRVNVIIQPTKDTVSVFTETPELLFGVSFLQVSSNHFLAISDQFNYDKATGLMNNGFAMHPLTSEEIPIVVKDSGDFLDSNTSRFGIPSLCKADQKIAEALKLKWESVVDAKTNKLVNSGLLNGLSSEEAKAVVCRHLKTLGVGGYPTSAKLKDWLISRQRYWGTPIPIVHCDSCGTVPVPEEDLPVLLPEISEFNRKGGNPLAQQHHWVKTKCPKCAGNAQRETDTMDTFVDSSWYFLRFTDPHNKTQAFSKEEADKYMPVDVYIGGAEHAILHMYYARFINHFLCDEGKLSTREPFQLQLALGTVHSDCYRVVDTGKYLHKSKVSLKGDEAVETETGKPVVHTVEKMSKSKMNGVSPQDVLLQHGVDQTRIYMLANEGPRATKYWNPDLVKKLMFHQGKQISIPKWLHTLWNTVYMIREKRKQGISPAEIENKTKAKIIKACNYNTRHASLHLNVTFNLHDILHHLYDSLYEMDKLPLDVKVHSLEYERYFSNYLILLHPFAPHFTAELWEGLRSAPRLPASLTETSAFNWDQEIFFQHWPLVDDEYKLPLHIYKQNKQAATSSDDVQDKEYIDVILLPNVVIKNLSIEQALVHAANAGLLNTELSEKPDQCKLVKYHNCGAELLLPEHINTIAPKERVNNS